MNNFKWCGRCKMEYNITDFYKDNSNKKDGHCYYCKQCSNESARKASKKYYYKKLIKQGKKRKRGDGYKRFKTLREYREFILNKYGHKCNCCGEDKFEFLAIDHVNNNGYIMRKDKIAGYNLYLYIEANEFPPEFQILCHNCNMAKGFYKKCPHNNLSPFCNKTNE